MKSLKIYSLLLNAIFLSPFLLAINTFAQSLEMAAGAGNPTGNGPTIANQVITFQQNANDPSDNVFSTYSPTITTTYSFSNQQYTSIPTAQISTGTGLSFGAAVSASTTSPLVTPSSIYPLMSFISSAPSTSFTSKTLNSAGSGIDVGTNRAVQVFTSAKPQTNGNLATNGRYNFGQLTITFSRPVNDPMIHIVGLGGTYGTLGFTTELELTTASAAQVSLSKKSGSTEFSVSTTKILNSAAFYTATTGAGAASGTVLATGTNITSITFQIYLKGDGGGTVWGATNGHTGDQWLIGVSTARPVTPVSGNVFNDPNGGNVNNSSGTTNAVPSGMFANLIDSNNKVVASTSVATDGTYSFSGIYAGTYTIVLSTTAGIQGATAPTASLPSGWFNRGEFNGTPNTGTDSTVNGISAAFTVATTSITNINFGISQLPNLSITKSSNGPWAVGQTGAEYTLTATNSGTAPTFGTTTIRDTLPTGITPNWTGTRAITNGGVTWGCTFSGQDVTCTTTDGLSNTAGSNTSQLTLPVNVTNTTPLGTNSITNYASIGGGGDPVVAPTPGAACSPSNHCASNSTTVNSPDLTIAKSHTPTTFVRGSTGTYNITVGNSGTASTSGTITVVDTLPTGLSIANGAVTLSGTNSANWSCNAASNVITCTSSTAIATSGSSTFGFNVNVAVNAAATVTNNVTVAGGGEATANSGNNSATDPTATVLPPSFGCSDKGYAIKNAGTIAEFWEIDIATGNSTSLINPIIPSSAGGQGANSIGYNPLDGLIYGKRIGTSEIIRIASDLSVQIIPITGLPTANLFAADVSANGIYYLTRTGYTTIERVDVNPSSPTYMTRLTPINVPAVNYSDIAINPNDGYAYAITDGTAPHSLLRIDLTTGSVTTIGTVTGGGSEAGTNFGSSWMDSNGNLFFNQGANGNTYKIASTHTLTTGAVTSTFVSTTTTGINDGAKCNTSAVVLGPNVSLAKSHTGNFTVGSSGTYSFTVSNTGETATSGTITVTDTLPIGLTVNGGGVGAITEGGTNAANWTCNSAALAGSPAQQTITCTSTTAIATSGISVFSFNVNVGVETAVGTNSITNTATVAGGGEIDTTNNSTSDPTTVLSPDLTIAKSHSGNFTRGSTGVYNITVGNSGTVATSGTITVSDTLPAGMNIADGAMTLGGANSANWTCNAASNVITCTSSTVIPISGSSTFTFTVNVASNAAATVNNTATISGGNEANANNGNNSSIDPTNTISSPPNVVLAKSCTVPSDCTTAPQLPGTDVTYRIAFTNSGGLGASNMTIVDGVPDNTDFKLGSVTTSLGTTGLTIAIEYSNDFNPSSPSSATWTYTPVSGGGGASTGYDRNVKAVRWRVTSGTLSNVSPNNNGYAEFSVKIR